MLKKQDIIIINIILLLSITSLSLYAKDVGQIYSIEYPDSKIIYFGPCLQNTSDTMIMNFVLQSYLSDTTIITNDNYPTFWLQFDFTYFPYRNTINFPIILSNNRLKDTIKIPFTTYSDEAIGRHEAMLIIGFLYIDDNTDDPENPPTAIYLDTFYLIGKNTNKYIDGYDDFVKFDSVFINQTTPVIKKFKVKNTYTTNINAINEEWNLISTQYTDPEFFIEQKIYPLPFFTGDNKVYREWDIGYNPKDMQPDTAEFRIIFIPDENNPNKLDTVKARLYGVGVTQSFNVVNKTPDCYVSENVDTIDIGSIRVGSTKKASISLRNVGNLNYRLVSQNIYDAIEDVPYNYFNIDNLFCKEDSTMKINDIDSFSISFSPTKKGTFIARYVLENDFMKRKILSNNINDYKKTIILKGIGVEPILQLEKDTIDFGNVSYANDINCPNQKDTIFTLFNNGNTDLIINHINIDNPIFQLSTTDIFIPANSSAQIKITFISNLPEELKTATMTFETLDGTLLPQKLFLFGKSIPPINASLNIPHLSVKPGTILEIPIELVSTTDSGSVTQYISNYSIYLSYNPALLSYLDYRTIGTASTGITDIEVNNVAGKLGIYGRKSYTNLEPNTNLIKLRFRTFLGDQPSTEIAIESAKLGISDLCDDYIKLNLNDGSYSIDSICGLEYKLNDLGKNKYDYSIAENDLGNIEINFTLPFEVQTQFIVCNYLGNELLAENYILPKGSYTKTILLTNFNAGIYYSIFRAGLYYKVIPFIKK